MNKKVIIAACTMLLCLVIVRPGYSANVCADFEDVPLDAMYYVGDTFVSSGVTVYHAPFQWSSGVFTSDGYSKVQKSGLAGGSGQDMMVNNINMYFIFGTPVSSLILQFGEYGGNINVLINGDFRNVENFSEINGTTIGGVAVSITNGPGVDQGQLRLTGTVDEFAIGGQELWIDDVCADRTCRLDLAVSYARDTLIMAFDIGTPVDATWNVWINYLSSNAHIISIPVPDIHPPVAIPVEIPNFPHLGTIGVLTTLTTPTEDIICSDWQTVDTGPIAAKVPSPADIGRLLKK